MALVQAVYAGGKITVNIKRLGAGETPARTSVDVPLLQTMGTTNPAAAQAAVHAIEDLWKTRTALDFSQRGRLTVDVRIASLAQWGDIQTQLAQGWQCHRRHRDGDGHRLCAADHCLCRRA